MARSLLAIASVILFVIAIFPAGSLPAQTDSSGKRGVAYRSKSSSHKVIVYAHQQELRDAILAEGGSVIAEYDSFSLLRAPAQATTRLAAVEGSGAVVRDDMNLILLRAGAFDTLEGEPQAMRVGGEAEPAEEQLYLVQAVGPVKREWLAALQNAAEVIAYVPNNAYLVRARGDQKANLDSLHADAGGFIQWAGTYKPGYKIAPEIALRAEGEMYVTVQLANSPTTETDIQRIAALAADRTASNVTGVLNYTNARIKVSPRHLDEIARIGNVVWVEPWVTPELFDERQGLIVAGGHSGNLLNPPGYLNWLQAKGLGSTPDFVVDIADSGIDKGSLDPAVIHRDFLNQGGVSRVVYARLFSNTDDTNTNDTGGHGTINASIIGGYNIGSSFPAVDSGGYRFGLGIHPYVKLGIAKIFNPEYTDPDLRAMLGVVYQNGARISSNSWGAYNNNYTTTCQLYDAAVRDAQPGQVGNQELTFVFASGNRGQDNLSAPATAKNVITVGASESLRPGIDGCGFGSDTGDDAQSVASFSSGGRTGDGRVKPEIVAPGTHIQGAQSQDAAYTGSGVCGPRNYPDGQQLYTWSSGTSHSTPAVAGAAAVVRHFFQQTRGSAPSPAMVKAFLTNSTSYMVGSNAGGDLPQQRQGWGAANLGRALDGSPRLLIDQTQVLSNSGAEYTLKGRVADPTKPFRVTLAWTDAPGVSFANPAVNDLDLRVEIGGKTYIGNYLQNDVSIEGGTADKLNNLEAVWTPGGTSGDFVIRVVAANVPGDGVPGNGDSSDQDFALVVYNAQPEGGGDGNPVDAPPTVNLRYPNGGESLLVGNLVRILWDAADDKGIQSQRVEFSSDNGVNYNTIATLNGSVRGFDWRIPAIPTGAARIRVTALDGANLPVSDTSQASFEVIVGPPDTTAPQVLLLSPNTDSLIAGGQTTTIKWKETDNVGVIQRLIELSTDGGTTFQPIISLVAPSSGEEQTYDWQVPAALYTDKGKVRISVYDGAGNVAAITSQGKFEVWALPIITDAQYDKLPDKPDQLELKGRGFRIDETEIYVDGKKLKKIRFKERCDFEGGTCNKITSEDKKIDKRVPRGEFVNIVVKLKKTGQTSPAFSFKRKRS